MIKARNLGWAVTIMDKGRSSFKIRMDPIEIGVNTRNWFDSTQDRDYWRALVNAALKLRIP
jgi:hypothetical protein